MPRSPFETLTETLLRGGIAPRHVRRYISELRDHYDDLLSAARSAGVQPPEAERAALARIGAPDELTQAMLDRDDLKSWAARYPALMFGVVPTLMLAAGVGIFVLCLAAVIFSFRLDEGYSVIPETWRAIVGVGVFGVTYVLPLIVAGIVAKIGLDQRVDARWLLIGIGIVGVIGGYFDISVEWPAYVGAPGELNFGLGLFPPYPQFGFGLMRTVLNVTVIAIPTVLMMRRYAKHA
ncbi:MAG: hypothetical protein JNM81_00760 [Rhodospirillaceae bacterium]|nr:hypothetical protein [Rhodospirillaceae bacterium]